MSPEYQKPPATQEKPSFISDAEKDQLKRDVDFLALAEALGVQNIKPGKGGQYTANSIFVEDEKRHLSFNTEKKVFQCFKSGQSGDVFRFVMLARRCSFHEAVCFVKDFHGGVGESSPKEITATVRKEVGKALEENPPLTFELKGLFREHPYFKEKGITPEMVELFGLGWQKAGSMAGRIVYPIHDERGRLVAYAGRAIKKRQEEEEGKYKFPPGFKKSLVLYNLHRVLGHEGARESLAEFGLIVVEGFNDVIKLWQQQIWNVVALMGTTMSEWQEEKILEQTNRVTLFLDNNDAGRRGTKAILNSPKDGGKNGLAYKAHVKLMEYPEGVEEPEGWTNQRI